MMIRYVFSKFKAQLKDIAENQDGFGKPQRLQLAPAEIKGAVISVNGTTVSGIEQARTIHYLA